MFDLSTKNIDFKLQGYITMIGRPRWSYNTNIYIKKLCTFTFPVLLYIHFNNKCIANNIDIFYKLCIHA